MNHKVEITVKKIVEKNVVVYCISVIDSVYGGSLSPERKQPGLP